MQISIKFFFSLKAHLMSYKLSKKIFDTLRIITVTIIWKSVPFFFGMVTCWFHTWYGRNQAQASLLKLFSDVAIQEQMPRIVSTRPKGQQCEKALWTDLPTDRRTDTPYYRDARTHLKTASCKKVSFSIAATGPFWFVRGLDGVKETRWREDGKERRNKSKKKTSTRGYNRCAHVHIFDS